MYKVNYCVTFITVLISDINFITSGVPFILLSVLNVIYLQDSLNLGVPYLEGNTEQRRRRRVPVTGKGSTFYSLNRYIQK
jgi:hypothetical protein